MTSTETDVVFYSLPAYALEEGMSTDDGQDIINGDAFVHPDGLVVIEVYTRRSDDEEQDEINRGESEIRMTTVWDRVRLAVFTDTDVDGSEYPDAETA